MFVKLSTSIPVANAQLRRDKTRNGQIVKAKRARNNLFEKKRGRKDEEEKIQFIEVEKTLEKLANRKKADLLKVKIQIHNVKTHQLNTKVKDTKQSCLKAKADCEELRQLLFKNN